jgi:multidrug efflux pump subunit AcrA (membrane-fusion protein)
MAKQTEIGSDDTYARDMRSATLINEEAIQEEFVTLPGLTGRCRVRLVEARRNRRLLGYEADLEEKRARARLRKQFLDEKLSATQAADRAREESTFDTAVVAARRAEEDAVAEVEAAEALLDTAKDKRDMLVSLGAHIRAEMESSISIRDRR